MLVSIIVGQRVVHKTVPVLLVQMVKKLSVIVDPTTIIAQEAAFSMVV